jgi:hypothetical protein
MDQKILDQKVLDQKILDQKVLDQKRIAAAARAQTPISAVRCG